ncbi:MAG: hypothetical protein O2930_04165 [Acidobacteria bacterium]|nr:hypothetical protein [Acidobacteriota bacterium]
MIAPSSGVRRTRHDDAPASWRRAASLTLAIVAIGVGGSSLGAQQLLDRVVARVNTQVVTLTDLRAALALGVVEVADGADEGEAIGQLVDRLLMLAEVARFAPPEPPVDAIAQETAALIAHVGSGLEAMMASTGIDDATIRSIARDTLRIEAYLDQRFGTAEQLSETEVARYYQIHPDEFTRDGTLMPFAQAEPLARQRAGRERRATILAQWTGDLRARGDVAVMRPTPPPAAPPRR